MLLLHPLLLLRWIHALVLPRCFLPFCTHQCVHLLEVQPSIFVFLGDEYTSSSDSHNSTWAFMKSSECSTCWLIVKVIWTPHSTTPQQTLNVLRACTMNKSSAFAGGFTVSGLCSYNLSGTFFFLGLQYCSVGTLFNRYMQLSYCASLVSFYKFRTPRNNMIYSFFLPVAYSAQWTRVLSFSILA